MSETKKVYMSVGGVDTYIVFTFHHYDDNGNVQSVPVLFGSAISLSYSTYRNKKPVFNLGSHVMDGFAIGTRYVAGTLIKTMFLDDELADALKEIKKLISKDSSDLYNINAGGLRTLKYVNNISSDDVLSFDINIIYTDEYTGKIIIDTIIGASFINNGQVMSVQDLVTETTLSYVAQDIKIHSDISSPIESGEYSTYNYITKASSLVGK